MHMMYSNITVFPPDDHGQLESVRDTLTQERPSFEVALVIEEQAITLPAQVIQAMSQVVVAMLDGQAVMVLPIHQTLTTQEAANLLGVRRRDLMDLLDEEEIPFHQEGRHRRIKLADILAFEKKRSQVSREALKRMTRIGYESDMHNLCAAPELTA